MLTMPEFAFLALCRLAKPLASPGPRCSSVEAGVPFMRKYPSAAPVTAHSNRPSTQRMPSTRSRAATKCISEVPGLAKQTSTPPATKVRTRLSAPFIISLPFETLPEVLETDQSFLMPFVKGVADIAAIAVGAVLFGRSVRKSPRSRARCLRNRANYGLSRSEPISSEDDMTRAFALLFAAVTVLASAVHAGAQGY